MIFVFVIMPMPVFCYWKHFSLCLSMYNVVVYVDTQVIANRGTCLVQEWVWNVQFSASWLRLSFEKINSIKPVILILVDKWLMLALL